MSTPTEPHRLDPDPSSPAPDAPVSPTATDTTTATDDREPQSMARWLWIAYPVGLIGIGAVWGAVLQVLLGRQVADLVADPRAAAGSLGWVISLGAITSLVAQPIMGRLSDATRIDFLGRRNIWILGGAIAGAVMLFVTSRQTSLWLLAIMWAIAMFPLSAVQAALTAVLPERVPLRVRGRMSGLVGMVQIVGAMIGVALAGLAGTTAAGFLYVAVFLLLASSLFALTTKDAPAPPPRTPETKQRAKLPGLREHRDFWLTFAARFLLILGNMFVSGFMLYLLRDYVRVGDGSTSAAAQAQVALSGINSIGVLIFALVGGILCDRFGKVRIFVAVSSLLFVPAAIIFIALPTYGGFMVGMAILGIAFGAYMAVDQVLITRVLPSTENAARDLGLMNIANAGPQVFAPALAGAIIASTGNYQVLFVIMIVMAIAAAVVIRFIKSVP